MLQQKQQLQQQLTTKTDEISDLQLSKAAIQEHANRLDAELIGVQEQLKRQKIANDEQQTEITRMTRTIDNGKEEKLAAERKKKAQEQKHADLLRQYEQIEKEKLSSEEDNKRLVQQIQDLQKVIHE